MIKLLTFLNRNKLLNFLVVTIYFLLVTLPHEWVGVKVGQLVQNITRAEFNRIVLITGGILLVLYLLSLIKNILTLKKKIIPILYLALTAAFAILSLNLLIIVNVEIIHFVQYGILAILLFPLVNNLFLTLFVCMILGFADEAFQYYMLPVRTNYYDFNDVVLDLIGAGFGISYLRTFSLIASVHSLKKSATRLTYGLWAALLLVAGLFIKIGFLQVYSNGEGGDHWSTLVIKKAEGFWTIDPHGVFHVLTPMEGILSLTILLIIYQFITKDLETNHT